MSIRTTATEVKLILDDSSLEDATVDAYITAASALVDSALGSSSLGDTLLEEIERWLTAHMIASTRERIALKEAAGGASITYTGQYGQKLSSTPYGQMVLVLDTTNTMASLGGKSASIVAITSFE